MSATRDALRDSFRFEPGLVAPVVGLITALPLVAVFTVGLTGFAPRAAVSLAVGANLVAVVSLVGAPRLSLPLAVGDACAMSLAVIVGVATTSITWLHVTLMVPLCFVAGYMTVFGLTQGVIGTQAIIAYVVLGRFSGSFTTALHLGLLVFLGALTEVGALVVLRLPPSLRAQRLELAAASRAVAELARSSPRRSATEILATVDGAERSLAAPSLFGRSDSRTLRAVLDQLRRVRLELTTMSGLRVRLGDRGSGELRACLDGCAGAVAATLDELAIALRRRSGSSWHEAANSFRGQLDSLAREVPSDQGRVGILANQCATHLRAIDGQLRAMGNLIDGLGGGDARHTWRTRLPSFARLADEEQTDLSVVRSNLRLDAPALRHGVRLAVAVPVSALVATWWSLPRGYWVPFAVAVILKPDYSTLLRRGIGRVLGTALGASLAAVVVSLLHPDTGATIALVAVLAWAAYSTWSASFPVAIGLVTALVLVLLSLAQPNPVSTAADRLIDVAIGGAISVLAYVVWPTSPRAGVTLAFADLFAALRDYLASVTPALTGATANADAAANASRASRVAWARAEAAVGRSVEEPSSTRVDPDEARGLLAVGMRVLRATHALRIEAERGATAGTSPELARLCEACGHALDVLSHHFANGTSVPPGDLRSAYRAAEERLSRDAAPSTIAVHFDELVNALNTAAHLIATNETTSA